MTIQVNVQIYLLFCSTEAVGSSKTIEFLWVNYSLNWNSEHACAESHVRAMLCTTANSFYSFFLPVICASKGSLAVNIPFTYPRDQLLSKGCKRSFNFVLGRVIFNKKMSGMGLFIGCIYRSFRIRTNFLSNIKGQSLTKCEDALRK